MKIIAIAGKSGSGKSTLAKYLFNNLKNALYINFDEINNGLLKSEPVINKAKTIFGNNIVRNNKIDKVFLSQAIFNNPNLYNTWMKFIMPICENTAKNQFSNSYSYIIAEHVLIPKTKIFEFANFKILCQIPEKLRIERLISRDKLPVAEIKKRDKFAPNFKNYSFDINFNDKNYETILDKIL